MELLDIPENPVPSHSVSGMIETSDHRQIRFARWRPTARKNLGTVCVFTGRSECIEKYFEVIGDLRRRGFHVAIIDWRGQGGSDRALRNPRKGHVDHFSEYERDVEALMNEVVLPDCPPPYYALAHSMGGCVLLNIARQPGNWFDRIVLSAPMIDIVQRNKASHAFAEVLNFIGFGSAFVPGGSSTATGATPFAGNPFTSDPARHERNNVIIQAKPELGLGAPTVGWFHAASEAMSKMHSPEYAYSVRTPVLIIAAGADKVVSTLAIEELAMHMRNGKHLVIPGARHELLMENDLIREMFWAAFDSFVPGQKVFG